MEFSKVRLEREGDIATLVLNDPKVLNAVSGEMLEGMNAALDEVEKADSGVRCLVLTGEGRGFCAGANFAVPRPAGGGGGRPDMGAGLEVAYHPLLRRLRNLEIPFITSVNGPAAGIGMSFALMGDIIIAARSAIFLQAFRHRGLVPDGGSTWLLPRLVGLARAKELAMLGDKLPAETAFAWGLITRLSEDNALKKDTAEMAKNLATAPFSVRLIRKAFWESSDNSYEQQLDLERQFQRRAGQSEDAREGVQSFLEKRPPNFQGK